MPLRIYKLDASPPVRAVLMTAELLNLKYETINVNTLAGETLKPEYVEKNPMHTVPLLEDGTFFLADSHAIITYLVSKYGAENRGKLYPSDLSIKATIDQRLFFDATVLFSAIRAIVRGIIREKAPEATEKQIADVNDAYGILEKYLDKTKFVACDRLTLADLSCVASVSTLEVLVPVDEKYEKVTAWLERLKQEEWYQKANAPGLMILAENIKIAMEKNSS